MIALQCLEIVQNACKFGEHRCFTCDVDMNFINSLLIDVGFKNPFENYFERKNVIKLNNANLEILRSVYTDHFFSSLKAKRFRVTLPEEEELVFWVAHVVLLLYSNIRRNEELSCEFKFVRFIEISIPLKMMIVFLNRQCFWWHTKKTIVTILLRRTYKLMNILT